MHEPPGATADLPWGHVQQAKAWDLWLDCREQQDIADEIGVSQPTVNGWLIEKRKSAETDTAP